MTKIIYRKCKHFETRANSSVLYLYKCVFYKISKIDTSCIEHVPDSGVRIHESISTWFYLGDGQLGWNFPMRTTYWDHTREISNTNSCINDINEL